MRILLCLFILSVIVSCSKLPTREQTSRYETYRRTILSHPSTFNSGAIPGGDSMINVLTSDDLETVVRKNHFNQQQVEDYLKALSISAEIVHADIMMDSAMKSLDVDSLLRVSDSLLKDSSAFLLDVKHK